MESITYIPFHLLEDMFTKWLAYHIINVGHPHQSWRQRHYFLWASACHAATMFQFSQEMKDSRAGACNISPDRTVSQWWVSGKASCKLVWSFVSKALQVFTVMQTNDPIFKGLVIRTLFFCYSWGLDASVGLKQHCNCELLITEVPLMDSSWEDLRVACIE